MVLRATKTISLDYSYLFFAYSYLFFAYSYLFFDYSYVLTLNIKRDIMII